jgi:hypothetical protein
MRCMLPTAQTLFSRAIEPHAVCGSWLWVSTWNKKSRLWGSAIRVRFAALLECASQHYSSTLWAAAIFILYFACAGARWRLQS